MKPNKGLQWSNHSALQSKRGTVSRRTERLRTDRGDAVARN
jgi:hypothetical protein